MRLIREENINTVEYWNRVYDFERRSGHRRQYNDLWKQMLKHLPPGQEYLVDIGCGAGGILEVCWSAQAGIPFVRDGPILSGNPHGLGQMSRGITAFGQ